MAVDDPRAVAEALAAQIAAEPGILNFISRLVPLDAAFELGPLEHAADRLFAAFEPMLPRLAGKSFHVRVHKRGPGKALSGHELERTLNERLLQALAARGTPGASPSTMSMSSSWSRSSTSGQVLPPSIARSGHAFPFCASIETRASFKREFGLKARFGKRIEKCFDHDPPGAGQAQFGTVVHPTLSLGGEHDARWLDRLRFRFDQNFCCEGLSGLSTASRKLTAIWFQPTWPGCRLMRARRPASSATSRSCARADAACACASALGGGVKLSAEAKLTTSARPNSSRTRLR